jgi:hypothetical protein
MPIERPMDMPEGNQPTPEAVASPRPFDVIQNEYKDKRAIAIDLLREQNELPDPRHPRRSIIDMELNSLQVERNGLFKEAEKGNYFEKEKTLAQYKADVDEGVIAPDGRDPQKDTALDPIMQRIRNRSDEEIFRDEYFAQQYGLRQQEIVAERQAGRHTPNVPPNEGPVRPEVARGLEREENEFIARRRLALERKTPQENEDGTLKIENGTVAIIREEEIPDAYREKFLEKEWQVFLEAQQRGRGEYMDILQLDAWRPGIAWEIAYYTTPYGHIAPIRVPRSAEDKMDYLRDNLGEVERVLLKHKTPEVEEKMQRLQNFSKAIFSDDYRSKIREQYADGTPGKRIDEGNWEIWEKINKELNNRITIIQTYVPARKVSDSQKYAELLQGEITPAAFSLVKEEEVAIGMNLLEQNAGGVDDQGKVIDGFVPRMNSEAELAPLRNRLAEEIKIEKIRRRVKVLQNTSTTEEDRFKIIKELFKIAGPKYAEEVEKVMRRDEALENARTVEDRAKILNQSLNIAGEDYAWAEALAERIWFLTLMATTHENLIQDKPEEGKPYKLLSNYKNGRAKPGVMNYPVRTEFTQLYAASNQDKRDVATARPELLDGIKFPSLDFISQFVIPAITREEQRRLGILFEGDERDINNLDAVPDLTEVDKQTIRVAIRSIGEGACLGDEDKNLVRGLNATQVAPTKEQILERAVWIASNKIMDRRKTDDSPEDILAKAGFRAKVKKTRNGQLVLDSNGHPTYSYEWKKEKVKIGTRADSTAPYENEFFDTKYVDWQKVDIEKLIDNETIVNDWSWMISLQDKFREVAISASNPDTYLKNPSDDKFLELISIAGIIPGERTESIRRLIYNYAINRATKRNAPYSPDQMANLVNRIARLDIPDQQGNKVKLLRDEELPFVRETAEQIVKMLREKKASVAETKEFIEDKMKDQTQLFEDIAAGDGTSLKILDAKLRAETMRYAKDFILIFGTGWLVEFWKIIFGEAFKLK